SLFLSKYLKQKNKFPPPVKQFWNEYVRESSPPGGLGTVPGGVHSLYLIVPLLLVLFVIAAVAITVWRCHSRKPSQRIPGLGYPHQNQALSTVSLDHLGRDHQHRDHSELSIHSCPAFMGPGMTPGTGSAEDPPPSYEEAVGHTDVRIETELPPQYDDIVHSSSSRSSRGQVK
uniref:Proline rich Gla (G-carboxyglutamic acid) 1 n=1 Tax=Oryzias melastigma TaxID=30732 RepID=A0A3B3DK34_ORYME